MKPQALCMTLLDSELMLSALNLDPDKSIYALDAGQAATLEHFLNSRRNLLWYIPRSNCETNTNFKQLIPYVVVTPKPGVVLCYDRPSQGSGDTRLKGQSSIGFGGHVEIQDYMAIPTMTLETAAIRELEEELVAHGRAPHYHPWKDVKLRLIGLINSQDTAVDKVHLGLIYEAYWQYPESAPSGFSPNDPQEVQNLRSVSVSHLGNETNMESWTSKIINAGLLDT